MLKDYLIKYIDKNGYEQSMQVLAFDHSQAIHQFIFLHPGVDTMGLSCTEL